MLLKQLHVPSDKAERDRMFNSCDHRDPQYPPRPTTAPLHLSRWLPLIFQDRLHDFIIVDLKPVEIRLVRDFTNAGIQYLRLNETSYEDLVELGITDKIDTATRSLGGQVFARWDEMSPKDGIHNTAPMTTAKQILNQICTSARTITAIGEMEKICASEGSELRCPLILMKYDYNMDTRHEFRCFVHRGRLTGISQYKWHEYSKDWSKSATSIWALAENMCARILRYNDKVIYDNPKDEYAKLLHSGFTFDVLVKGKNVTEEVEEVQLVELNSFGPNSLCGAALFHWVRDYPNLTGADGSIAEMRIRAPPDHET